MSLAVQAGRNVMKQKGTQASTAQQRSLARYYISRGYALEVLPSFIPSFPPSFLRPAVVAGVASPSIVLALCLSK